MDRRMVLDSDIAELHAVVVGAADAEMVALEAALRAAQLAADVPALARLVSDDLLFTGPDGQLGTKAQDLEAHGSGGVRCRRHQPEGLRMPRGGRGGLLNAARD